jgi:hypothetical protein
LTEFDSGTILIGVLGHLFKCPPTPFEGAFMVYDQLRRRGIRGDVKIRIVFPMAAPVPVTREVSATFLHALQDVAATGVAKAGVFAEATARVVVEDIVARIRGTAPPARYDGAGNCYVEFGGGLVGKVQANFLAGPTPTATLLAPSTELAREKQQFGETRRLRWFGP